jgi:hypothetical protein
VIYAALKVSPILPILAATLDAAERMTGTPHVAHVDRPWERGPAGHIDLFQRFSDAAGVSCRLLTAELRFPGGGRLPVYLMPAGRAGPFAAFLGGLRVTTPGGRAVRPVLLPGGTWATAAVPDPVVAAAVAGCHVIGCMACGPGRPSGGGGDSRARPARGRRSLWRTAGRGQR